MDGWMAGGDVWGLCEDRVLAVCLFEEEEVVTSMRPILAMRIVATGLEGMCVSCCDF